MMSPLPPKNILLSDYAYTLPENRIATRPLAQRDASKLLVFHGTGTAERQQQLTSPITHTTFAHIANYLPENSLLVANKSKVVAARLLCEKPTGGIVEVLLTHPINPSADPAVVLSSTATSTWNCLIGGRNVHEGMLLRLTNNQQTTIATLEVLKRNGSEAEIRIECVNETALSRVLEEYGHVPLPPYIKRGDDEADKHQYQTVFAKDEGSVAAPTAGLHFTESTLKSLKTKNIDQTSVTLHVGLGTFQPVAVSDIADHTMHRERFEIERSTLVSLIDQCAQSSSWITAVGTTSMRTLESLYWCGVELIKNPEVFNNTLQLSCAQWSAFDMHQNVSRVDALRALSQWMDVNQINSSVGYTALCLAPGAAIRMVDALVTNFHQPGNTLIMLVAAFIGESWRDVYNAALQNDYRFLSYGDSSLLVFPLSHRNAR